MFVAIFSIKGQEMLALCERSTIYYLLIIKLVKIGNWKADLKDDQLQVFYMEITKHVILVPWFPAVNKFKTITTTLCQPYVRKNLWLTHWCLKSIIKKSFFMSVFSKCG